MVVKDLELVLLLSLWLIVCLVGCVVIVVCLLVLCCVVVGWSLQRDPDLVSVHTLGRCICWLWRMLFVWCLAFGRCSTLLTSPVGSVTRVASGWVLCVPVFKFLYPQLPQLLCVELLRADGAKFGYVYCPIVPNYVGFE